MAKRLTETVLHSLDHSVDRGSILYSGLLLERNGNLYGTTYMGGRQVNGTVFELTPGGNGTWTAKLLHSFNSNGHDGLLPYAGLIFHGSGNLYGTTTEGGNHGSGSVFEVTP